RECVANDGEHVFEPEDVLPQIAMWRNAAPDLTFTVLNALLAESRNVVLLKATGTHTGDLKTPIGTLARTDKPFAMNGIEVFDVREDRIAAVWVSWDWGALLASLDVRV
ncbi:MAG: ester cyclase, partial [Gaiellaceae bacterium]